MIVLEQIFKFGLHILFMLFTPDREKEKASEAAQNYLRRERIGYNRMEDPFLSGREYTVLVSTNDGVYSVHVSADDGSIRPGKKLAEELKKIKV